MNEASSLPPRRKPEPLVQTVHSLAGEEFEELRCLFEPAPPEDLLEQAKGYLRATLQAEGKLDASAWAAKLEDALEAVRATFPPERQASALRNYREAFRVRESAAHLAAHATALTLFASERKAGNYTTLWQCLETAFLACRLPARELPSNHPQLS